MLSDLYDRLIAAWRVTVSIVGHTSTEGTEDYNLALSKRRAQSVVDDSHIGDAARRSAVAVYTERVWNCRGRGTELGALLSGGGWSNP